MTTSDGALNLISTQRDSKQRLSRCNIAHYDSNCLHYQTAALYSLFSGTTYPP